jgi:hypothetical protein
MMIASDSERNSEEESDSGFSSESSPVLCDSAALSDALLTPLRLNPLEIALRSQPDDPTMPVDDALSFVTDLFDKGNQFSASG